MRSASRAYPVRVADGGALITTLSKENVGEANWVRKLNMRRDNDVERRQEGWVKFVDADSYTFDGVEQVMRLAELVRPNGERAIVGASRTKIKRYNSDTGAWDDISGGLTFSSSGKRWQVDTLNGYLILNNAVDLPVSFRVEDSEVTQIHEMRQVGIASVGRIRQYNGFLLLADVTEIKADQLDPWMNGYTSYSITSSSSKAASFAVVFATDYRKQFNVTTGASTVTVTLPTMTFSNVPFWFWVQKIDGGAGTVITSPLVADQPVVLSSASDLALVRWTGSAWAATVFSAGVIPATDPYGTPPASITNRVPYEVMTGEFGDPTRWAPLFNSTMAAASSTIILPFVPDTWVAGQTRVGVINGGPSAATLGGQIGYDDGVLVVSIGTYNPVTNGVAVVLETTTDTGLQYPRNVQVTRWTDISTLVARYLLQDDGSPIIGMECLGEQVILFRTSCIYVGRFTGDSTDPFVFRPRYPGKESRNLPIWGDAIANVNGDYLLYPGNGNRFYKFDGVSWPTIHQACDNAKEMFYAGVSPTDEVFWCSNFLSKQIWFCSSQRTYAFDFEFGSVSEIDAVVGAGCFAQAPASTDEWFVLAIGRFVYTYGLCYGAGSIMTWLRDGVAPTAVLRSGLISAGLMTDEKILLNYTPVLGSASSDTALEVQLYSTYNPSGALTTLLTPVESLPTPAGENFFATFFQAIFFQDEITLVDTRDVDFQLTQRVFEFNQVGEARGVTRAVGMI